MKESKLQMHLRVRKQLEHRAYEIRNELYAIESRWDKHQDWIKNNSLEDVSYNFGDVLA